MLRGDLDGAELEQHVEQSVLTTTIEKAGRWAVGNANFPLSFGLACCAIEWMSHIGPRIDIARFGFEAARATPRQADTIFLSGRISIKMAPVIRRIYEQMLEPRYVIAMGACSSSMGVFNNYALVPGDKFLPVDVHVPGCPPRPESLVHGILKLRAAILSQSDEGWRTRYGGRGTEEVVADLRREDPDAVTNINVSGGTGGTDRVPDATGLELIAQELRDADADARARHRLLPRAGRAARRAGGRAGHARAPARQGLPLPRLGPRRRLLPRGAAPRRALRAARHARGRPHLRAHARDRSTTRTCRA